VVIGLPFLATTIADFCVIYKYGPQIAFDPILWSESAGKVLDGPTTNRQRMARHLVREVLPRKNRAEIEQLLGPSATHEGMRRYSDRDLAFREKDENGEWKPFPRTGPGYYWDQFDWDLLYVVGREQILFVDHKGQMLSFDSEVLLIRLDPEGVFSSWYIDGSDRWPRIVGIEAMGSFREKR